VTGAAPGTAVAQPQQSTFDRVADRTAAVVLFVVAALAAATFRDYGLGWDDYTHAQYGELLLAFYRSGFTDTRAFSFVNLYMYGGGFDMAAALLANILPIDLFETRRLAGATVGLIGLIVTWRLARRLGGAAAGLIALALLATCPIFYGHMFMNAKDAPFAVAMTILIVGLVRGCEEYPRISPATAVIVALGFGLSIGSRVLGVLGGIYALVALVMMFALEAWTMGLRPAGKRLGRFVLVIIPVAVASYVIMGVLWPWSVLDPLNPFRALEYFSAFFEKPWRELFDGVALMVYDMPRTYLPTLLAFQLSELMIVLALLGTAGALVAVIRGTFPPGRRASLFVVLLAAYLPIIITIVERPALYNGIRHFLFLLPPLAVLGGLSGGWLLERASKFGRAALAICVAVLLAGFASPVVEMVRLHPYQYTHYNHIAGGIQLADSRFMLDYWALSFKAAAQELHAKLAERKEMPPAGRPWKIAVCGPHPPAQVALGPDFAPTWDPKDADFALMLGEFYCAQFDAPVLAEIAREGVVYARVYDIRGRSVPGMFTLPPVR